MSLQVEPQPLKYRLLVAMLLGNSMVVELVCSSCVLWIGDQELFADSILLQMSKFNLILGIDWLASYHASVDCYSKITTFQILRQKQFQFRGINEYSCSSHISTIWASYHLLRKGCWVYLAHVSEVHKEEQTLEIILWWETFLMYSLMTCQDCHLAKK